MKSNPRFGKQAFTLVELMAVITIIVILASLVVKGMSFVTDKQAKSKAQVQIELMSKAIQEYKLDMGKYPGVDDNSPANGSKMSEELYEALFYEGYDFAENPGRNDADLATKIYLPELDPSSSKQGWTGPATKIPARTQIKDPWGREFRYRKGNNAQNPDFDLWSTGKDGESNTGNSSGALNDPKNRDDLRNF
ncbi:MAG: type II secretion system protein GspG [Verrucomicrobiota bacterium]